MRLTSSGAVHVAALSRDGRFLAYVERGRLLVRNVADGGRPVEVSRDMSRFENSVQWFPDGTHLLASGDSGIFQFAVLGGAARRIANASTVPGGLYSFPGTGRRLLSPRLFAWARPRLSSDGRLVTIPAGSVVQILDVASGTRDSLALGDGVEAGETDWSPDARWVVVETREADGRYGMRVGRPSGGSARRLVADSTPFHFVRWHPAGDGVYYVSVRNGGQSLWWTGFDEATAALRGRPRLVSPLLDYDIADVNLLGAAPHLVLTRTLNTQTFWLASPSDPRFRRDLPWAVAGTWLVRVAPDGRRIAFSQSDGQTSNLFVVGVDSGDAQQLTFFGPRTDVRDAAWAPGGDRIALCLVTPAQAAPRVTLVRVGDAEVTDLAVDVPRVAGAGDCGLSWVSSDEVTLFGSGASTAGRLGPSRRGPQSLRIRSVRVAEERIAFALDSSKELVSASASTTQGLIAFSLARDSGRTVFGEYWVASLRDTTHRRVGEGYGDVLGWDRDTRYFFVSNYEGDLRRLDATGREPPLPLGRPCAPGRLVAIWPDGQRVACREGRGSTDVWLIRNIDPAAPAPPTRRRR